MPVQAIMLNATCELRAAFLDINSNKKYKNFKADEWSINITLTPKVDTQIQGMFGHTGKSTTNKNALEYITWTLGASPGLRLDLEGHRDGAVSFPIPSRNLLDPKGVYPLFGCQEVLSNSKALSQYLGIREWLERIIPASGTGLSDITHVDKPSFSTQIIVKFDAGNAGPTFFVPNGSTFSPTLAALRKHDQTLSITMTPDPNKEVQTFPEGAIKTKQAKQEGVSPAAQSRLDQIQLERTIQNLRIRAE